MRQHLFLVAVLAMASAVFGQTGPPYTVNTPWGPVTVISVSVSPSILPMAQRLAPVATVVVSHPLGMTFSPYVCGVSANVNGGNSFMNLCHSAYCGVNKYEIYVRALGPSIPGLTSTTLLSLPTLDNAATPCGSATTSPAVGQFALKLIVDVNGSFTSAWTIGSILVHPDLLSPGTLSLQMQSGSVPSVGTALPLNFLINATNAHSNFRFMVFSASLASTVPPLGQPVIPIALDGLFFFSLTNIYSCNPLSLCPPYAIFINTAGLVGNGGTFTSILNIPNDPGLIGLTAYGLGVTTDSNFNISGVTVPLPITFQ